MGLDYPLLDCEASAPDLALMHIHDRVYMRTSLYTLRPFPPPPSPDVTVAASLSATCSPAAVDDRG